MYCRKFYSTTALFCNFLSVRYPVLRRGYRVRLPIANAYTLTQAYIRYALYASLIPIWMHAYTNIYTLHFIRRIHSHIHTLSTNLNAQRIKLRGINTIFVEQCSVRIESVNSKMEGYQSFTLCFLAIFLLLQVNSFF